MQLKQIPYSNEVDWLEKRRHGIGGSDAAAIVGLNPFSGPYAVWANKLKLVPDFKGNEATRQGSDLEEYVAKRFTLESGKKVRRRNKILINPEYPFAFANIDRWIVGENAGLECKTTSSLNLSKFKNGEFPPNYYIQCLHYMAVTGADKWYLAVLVFSKEFLIFEIERDDEMISNLMEAEKNFWELVKTKTPPAPDGVRATDDILNHLYSESDESSTDLFYMRNQAERLLELKEQKKEIETEIKKIEQEFKTELGNSEKGILEGYSISWKPQTRRTFQTKLFLKEHPEFDLEPYYKESNSRVFRLKEL